jgi:hypothetical protein
MAIRECEGPGRTIGRSDTGDTRGAGAVDVSGNIVRDRAWGVHIGDPWENGKRSRLDVAEAFPLITERLLGLEYIEPVGLSPSGKLTVSFTKEMAADDRGCYLRAIESDLREDWPSIDLYVEPQADKNALRRLRGVV